MKTMKKVLALLLVVALTATVAVNVTLAYLQDEDEAVNVMTLGNVNIEQLEQERGSNGALVEFKQDKPLYPAVYEGSSIEWDDADNWPVADNEAWKTVVHADGDNVVDKFVTVKNTGVSAAYVRTVIAYEGDAINGSDIHIVHNTNTSSNPAVAGQFADAEFIEGVVIDGVRYDVIVYTYAAPLQPGATTVPSLKQIYMDSACGNDEVAKYGATYDVLTVSQAVQAMGFDDAKTALNAAFGEITTDNHPWTDGIAGGRWDGSADDEGLKDNTDETAKTVSIKTPEQLAAFADAVNSGNSYAGYTVNLTANIDLAGKAWTPIGACNGSAYFQGTFNGNGYTISNLNVDKSTDDYMYSTAGLFGWVDQAKATITNVNINGAKVSGSHWVGVIAGYMTGEISNCTVTNATVVGNNVNADANGDKIGGLVGYVNSGSALLNNTVSNSTITGYRDVGGLAGAVAVGNTVTNNTVRNVDILYAADYAGEIVSPKTAVVVDSSNTASNVTVSMAASAADNEALGDAIEAGATTVTLSAGTYSIPSSANGKELTINGTEDTIIKTGNGGGSYVGLNGASITFNGVTVQGQTSGQYNGYAHAGTMTYNNCTIEGTLTIYSDSVFTDCTFNLPKGCYIWTAWGAGEVTYENCVFNTEGKALLIYHENGNSTINVNNCTFNATAGDKAGAIANQTCAAIEIDNSGKGVGTNTACNFTLNTSGNTIDSDFSGEWRIKTYDPAGSVTVNGTAYTSLALDGKTMTIDASKNVTVN